MSYRKPKPRFRATPSKIHDNSYNVIQIGRRNQWGNPYVVQPALARKEAFALAERLNNPNNRKPFIDISTGERF